MEVSTANSVNTTTNTKAPEETGKDPMEKALEVKEQAVMKVLEGIDEQSKEVQKMNAQKTGMGNTINLTA